ncbi:MAG: Rrf2 family transcriptional regulator, partial [Deltaproteobacteria bacterium]|nr:Rrf2 family transcriptional regulator [Deltaproteobacteria bacterium]
MKVSTRTRYGLRLMASLAEQLGQGPIFLKDIAKEQDISEKYLSLIAIPLRSAGLIQSTRGS